MKDISDRYEKLHNIFHDEASDLKKAEQSLFLIENNLNILQTREKQICEKFVKHNDFCLQENRFASLKSFITNLENHQNYSKILDANFDKQSINANLLIFSQLDHLLKDVREEEKAIEFKHTFITRVSNIRKKIEEGEALFSSTQKKEASQLNTEDLLKYQNCIDSLGSDTEYLEKLLEHSNLLDHIHMQHIQKKGQQWKTSFLEIFKAYVKAILNVENKNIWIYKEKLLSLIVQKAFWKNTNTFETITNLRSAINDALCESLKSLGDLSRRSETEFISIKPARGSSGEGAENTETKERVLQVFKNFKVVYEAYHEINEIIIRNTSTPAFRVTIDKQSQQLEKSIYSTLTSVLFPFINQHKELILENVLSIESQYALNLQSIKNTIDNYKSIELLQESEKKLIEWKNQLFESIQLIQANSNQTNHENFYRQIGNVIKEMNEYFNDFSEIKDVTLENKLIDFEIQAIKLIILVIKIVEEERVKKTSQLLNLKSSAFTMIQDLIINLLSVNEDKKLLIENSTELHKMLKYFNNQEINTWVDLKNANL